MSDSHSQIGFFFKSPKKWTEKHLDSLNIQDYADVPITDMMGESLPGNDDTVYNLLNAQITLPSKEDILTTPEDGITLLGNSLFPVFNTIHKIAHTPEDKVPPRELLSGIFNLLTNIYHSHKPEAKNVWTQSKLLPFEFKTCQIRGALKCHGGVGYVPEAGEKPFEDRPIQPFFIYNTVEKPDDVNRVKYEIPFGLFLAFAAFDRKPDCDEYVSFVFNLRRTSIQLTKTVASKSYLQALSQGQEVSGNLRIYRSQQFDLLEPEGRKAFIALFVGVMKQSLTQFYG